MSGRVRAAVVGLAVSVGTPASAAPPGDGAAGVHVTMPRRASDPVRLATARGMAIAVSLHGGRDVAGEPDAGGLLFRGATAEGNDLRLRRVEDGFEDVVTLTGRAGRSLARYRLQLTGVAGLRLVGNSLELLDPGGTPRLRMAPPWLVDARGARHFASVTLHRCRADRDPRPPWGRPIIPPGASTCEVELGWPHRAELVTPAQLDPLWTSTTSLAVARAAGGVALGGSGRVLVAGGRDGAGPLASVEIYDDATGTWAMATPLPGPRVDPTLTWLEPDKAVLVAGGCAIGGSTCGPTGDAWLLHDDGRLEDVGPLPSPRAGHAAFLAGDDVLLAGGRHDDTPGGVLASTARLVLPERAWSVGPPLGSPRERFADVALDGGQRLIVGGGAGGSSGVLPAELYDPVIDAWAVRASLAGSRREPTAVRLPDGRVLVVGGAAFAPLATSELYDPETDAFATGPPTVLPRLRHGLALAGNGWLLLLGGCCNTPVGLSTEALAVGEAPATWRAGPALDEPRSTFALAPLPGGRHLVAGGWRVPNTLALASSIVVALAGEGSVCLNGATCASGHCADGVCCDAPCDQACTTCLRANGASEDGRCTVLTSGFEPRGRCVSALPSSCGPDGRCDALGGCSYHRDTLCPCSRIEQAVCDGRGACACPEVFCEDEVTAGTANGSRRSCVPYRCGLGQGCLTACNGSLECAPGHVCDRDRRCIEASPPATPEPGCSLGGRPAPVGHRLPWLAAAWWARRRRRTTARRPAAEVTAPRG